jgi:hypothetical protein
LFEGSRILAFLVAFSGSEVAKAFDKVPAVDEAGIVVKMVRGSCLLRSLSVVLLVSSIQFRVPCDLRGWWNGSGHSRATSQDSSR